MWHPDDVDDVYSDIRLAFGHRYARHLAEAAARALPDPAAFTRLGALWVQRVLGRGALWRDVDGDAVVLRLPVGPWTFDFAFRADGADARVIAGHPDTLCRDVFPLDEGDFDADDLARLAGAPLGGPPPAAPTLPDLAWP